MIVLLITDCSEAVGKGGDLWLSRVKVVAVGGSASESLNGPTVF
jgi:hypothetical protein